MCRTVPRALGRRGEDGGEVDEGVAEETGAALDGGVGVGVDRRDLYGVGQGVGQIELRRARRHA